ncbi:MAG: hypothetical protein IID40_01705 [Planctomycetes bacterium]|nr:hypothetical protein [Planctomycetota bacterium]
MPFTYHLDTYRAIVILGILLPLAMALQGCAASDSNGGGGSADAGPADASAGATEFAEEIEAVLAGLEDSEPNDRHPYVGVLRLADGTEVGPVHLSTCGCGDWRGYVELDGARLLGRLIFPGYPLDLTAVHTDPDDELDMVGKFYDDRRAAYAELRHDGLVGRFNAERDTGHSPLGGCLLCHVGDDAPSPLPDTHRAVDADTDCLTCHDASFH